MHRMAAWEATGFAYPTPAPHAALFSAADVLHFGVSGNIGGIESDMSERYRDFSGPSPCADLHNQHHESNYGWDLEDDGQAINRHVVPAVDMLHPALIQSDDQMYHGSDDGTTVTINRAIENIYPPRMNSLETVHCTPTYQNQVAWQTQGLGMGMIPDIYDVVHHPVYSQGFAVHRCAVDARIPESTCPEPDASKQRTSFKSDSGKKTQDPQSIAVLEVNGACTCTHSNQRSALKCAAKS